MPLTAAVSLGFLGSAGLLTALGCKWALEKKVLVPWSLAISAVSAFAVYPLFDRLGLQAWLAVLVVPGLAGLVSAAALAWRFYRDPERVPPPGDSLVLSPADGKVIYIKPILPGATTLVEKNGASFPLSALLPAPLLENPAWLIGISMSYLDVHVNRAPIAGIASRIRHIPGVFLSLKRPEAVFRNERLLTVIDGGWLKVAVIQIASRLVRRIVSYVSENSDLARAQRIGKITLGSQVDVLISSVPELGIRVECGQQVRAGLSVLASRTGAEQKAAKKV